MSTHTKPTSKRAHHEPAPCPCGGATYASCCEPLHKGYPADTPAQLMRSRYSAYVLKRTDYLIHSWHPETCPEALNFGADCVWLGLEIRSSQISADQTSGHVSFVARYRVGGGSAVRMTEHSEFLRLDGRWVYWRAVL